MTTNNPREKILELWTFDVEVSFASTQLFGQLFGEGAHLVSEGERDTNMEKEENIWWGEEEEKRISTEEIRCVTGDGQMSRGK